MNFNKGISTPLVIGIIAVVVLIGGGVAYYYTTKTQQSPVACTQEAKICPDGSAVSRTGPNCEFPVCPSVKVNETAGWKTYINEDPDGIFKRFNIKYPADAELTKVNGMGIEAEIDLKLIANPHLEDVLYIFKVNNSVERCRNPLLAMDVKNLKTEDIVLGGLNFKKETWQESNAGLNYYYQGYRYYSTRGYYCYTLNFVIKADKSSDVSNEYNLFDKIISTFEPIDM